MDKPKIFISHITEERQLAELIKTQVQKDFLGLLDVFVSSDSISIAVGSKWLNKIDEALQSAQVELYGNEAGRPANSTQHATKH